MDGSIESDLGFHRLVGHLANNDLVRNLEIPTKKSLPPRYKLNVEAFVIFGATGQQGGALVTYLLNHPVFSKEYRLRGVTRDSSKPGAQELAKRSVEVVSADLSKPETLPPVVEGAHVVFSVTNFWDNASAEVEQAQGKVVADAARAAGVTQFIWSSLPSIEKETEGQVTSYEHFDSKAKVEEYLPDGTIRLPYAWTDDLTLPYIDINDTGKYLGPALRDPAKWNGRHVLAATAFYSLKEITDTWSRVTGKTVRCSTLDELPPSTGSWFEENLSHRNPVVGEVGYFGPSGPAELRELHAELDEELNTWEEYNL
ncbi:unnamed protein product [Parascedosporium putredinis]|uniref:NmrA-like domain-containing protein n=1 Tax=Parascedosporium putredinis TaxID=1442378 RepID=A0A9P1H9I3_9PEZI|nr:unnamed protein product [Parascedosporium putredinis]CAI8001772.1 unnamed protein product [Parascedosporium putredinis]